MSLEQRPLQRNLGLSFLALIASSGTLVCCVLPAVMVSVGAGAALAGLVGAVPQLIWLSELKALVFGIATVLVGFAGVLLWNARRLPCPADPALAASCASLRRWSVRLWWLAALSVVIGAVFAFLLPRL